MPNHLSDLKQIVHELKARDFALAITDFTYNQRSYFVLIKRYIGKKPEGEEYALARLEFIFRSDTSVSKEWPANSNRIMSDPKDIRQFFHIPYREGGVGDAIQTLYARLGAALLGSLRMRLSPEERRLAVASLSESDSENPDRVYCFAVRRNPMNAKKKKRAQRSVFNSQKAAILRPDLYQRLKNETGVSFCFSLDPDQERSDAEIYASFKQS